MTVHKLTLRHRRRGFLRRVQFWALLLALPASGVSQQAASPPPSAGANAPEITSHEELPTFRVKVNLVEVRVVVRDAKGHIVDNLKQEDFELFDNGKPQIISKFSIERATGKPTVRSEPAAAAPDVAAPSAAVQPVPVIAKRFVAYLFDDMHLEIPDLSQARNAAIKHLQSLSPEDRAGVFTTSGQSQQDFTDDRVQLISAMNRIVPRSQQSQVVRDCPDITYYMADMIANKHDQIVEQMALQDAQDCGAAGSQAEVEAAALRELEIGDNEIQISFSRMEALVRRMAELPGQRTIVLVSPGFMNSDLQWKETELMDRAVHSNIVINTLDARGLYTPGPDVSQTRQPLPTISGRIEQYRIAEQEADEVLLADLADATGGTFFHHNNDLDEGFRRLAAPPPVSYLLGFAPQTLKLNGSYHNLKVKLKPPAAGSVQARKGYFAPKGAADSSEQARQAIEDAVFSQEEVREIPVELHTQFFKPDDNDAKLSVVARVDVKQIHFHKANGRNNNDVTVVSALFDRNGNFIAGTQKLVQLHLKDETLDSRLGSGITLKSSFDVKPGSYVVRLVVRDADGQLAAQNLAVQIP